MIEDLMAHRRAAIEARERAIAESEFLYEISIAEEAFDEWVERERIKRERYEQAMAEKRARTP